MNDGPREMALFERVSNVQAACLRHEALDEFVVNRFGHDDPARGYATLATRLERTDQGRRHRQVEPGISANDDGAFAARFGGHDAVEMLRRKLLDAPADFVASGEQNN